MVISLKVKTLDSQTYEFSVDNEISVRQFKETIAEKTNISADLQRIIYCGRVLADEKQLKEYDVNGKVVHVVERAPPNMRTGSSSSENGNRRQRDNMEANVRASPIFRALDGMVVGAMTIPVTGNGATTQPTAQSLNPSSSFCMNRITVARHMLECANNIASYLENPERGLNNSSLDIITQGRWTVESTVVEVGISAAGSVDIPQNQSQNFVEALHGAVSAALRQNGHPNVTVLQLPTVFGSNGSAMVSSPSQTIPAAEVIVETDDTSNNTSPTPPPPPATSNTDSTTPQESQERSESTTASSNGGNNSPTRQRTGTRVLAEVIHQMRTVQTRLEPFFQQYYDILLNDPSFEENDTAGRENAQRIYDRVSEALHYMSHAQHAISDLMLDMSQNTPRHLCCRPILVEQSGFVSSNNYLTSFLQPNGNNNETATTNNNASAATTATNTSQTDQQAPTVVHIQGPPPASFFNATPLIQQQSQPPPPPPPRAPTTTGETNTTSNQNSTPEQTSGGTQGAAPNPASGQGNQVQVARLIQAVLNSAPIHADVHVQINAPNLLSYGMPVPPPTSQTPTQTQSTSQTNGGTANNGTESNNTESNQPRVTTATHPTTSTQTRSTARPQVHVANLPSSQMWNARVIPANMLSSFDRFLPCSSHHIRDSELAEVNQHVPNMYLRARNQVRQRRQTADRASSTSRINTAATNPPSSGRTTSMSNDVLNVSSSPSNTTIHLFGSNISLRELLTVPPSPSTLNRIRNELQTFIVTTLFSGEPITDENMNNAINEVIQLLNGVLLFLPQFDLPDYDSRASVENFIRNTLPFIINLIREDDSNEFGTRLLRELISFVRRLFVILVTCVGRSNAELYLNQVAQMTFSSNNPLEQDALRALHRHLMASAIRQLDLTRRNTSDIQEFLVIRRPPPESNPNSNVTPMETDDLEQSSESMTISSQNAIPPQQKVEQTPLPIPPPISGSDDPLPQVVPGTEPWHSDINPLWLPIITRDIERQRRQSPQGPFSDAYISGMSAKRRKLVTNSKPPTDVTSLLSDGVRRALQTVGVTGTSSASVTPDEVSTVIASDPIAQTSYREALRSNVQERLKTDPDFTPDKFPNSSKYFNK